MTPAQPYHGLRVALSTSCPPLPHQVKSVDSSNFSQHPSSSGLPSYGYLTVTASLDESATLHGRSDGGQSSGYRSSYDAQYRVVQAEDGSWRVAQVTVLEESRDTAS